jgi:hypothetical protein
LVRVAKLLREEHEFRGYIHLKTIPEADPALIEQAGRYADRLSVNIELPTNASLQTLAPEKQLGSIRQAMRTIYTGEQTVLNEPRAPKFAPAGQSTQMIVGADDTDDSTILHSAQALYGNYKLRRVYYSAFSPIPNSPKSVPLAAPPLMREHRLYQADFLLRSYGYSAGELFPYQYDWSQSNKTSAAGLATFVRQVLARTGASQVDIVNHSMGGLVSLWYLKQLGGAAKVDHLASIAGANHGTNIAATCLIFTTCQQMYPGSSFIKTITSGDETPGSTRYATWYSSCDGVIIPYTSTILSGATNNLITCQTHNGFLTDTSVLTAIRTFLGT